MPDLKRTVESVYHNPPDKNSTTQSQEADELRQQTSSHVKTTLEKAPQPEQKKPKSAADILRSFAAQLQQGRQRSIMLDVARKTAEVQDFGTSELSRMYQTKTNNIRGVLQSLFNSLEKLGLKKIQITEIKKGGHRNHYLIVEPINKPSESPKEKNKKKIKKGDTQYEKVTRNLDFIPNKFHDVLLFLALSSKYNNWVDYNEIAEGIKKCRGGLPQKIKKLKGFLQKIGLELLEEKNKTGKKHFHLAEPNKSNNKRIEFQEKEEKREKNRRTPKTRRLPKTRTTSTSNTILRRRPKDPPNELDERYDNDGPSPKPRRPWEDASGKSGPL